MNAGSARTKNKFNEISSQNYLIITWSKPSFEKIHFRINSWFAFFATSTTVRNNSDQNCFFIDIAKKWTTWITLASIFTRCCDIILSEVFSLSWTMRKTSTQFVFMQYKFIVIRIVTKIFSIIVMYSLYSIDHMI